MNVDKLKGAKMKVPSKQSLKEEITRLKKVIDTLFEMMAQKDAIIQTLQDSTVKVYISNKDLTDSKDFNDFKDRLSSF